MGACEDRNGAATWWASACVVTNYGCRGCRGLCRGCTAEGAVRVQETDEEAVLESVRLLSPYIGSLAVGGCEPLYGADGDRVRFLSGLFREMLFRGVATSLHTSMPRAFAEAFGGGSATLPDTVVYRLSTLDQLKSLPRVGGERVRAAFVVGEGTTPEFLERAAEMVRYGGCADELAFLQEVRLLVDASTPPPTGWLPTVVDDPQERLVPELEAGERKGKWEYVRHGGDVAYVVNGTVYRSYGAIASCDGVPVAHEARRMAAESKGMALCPWLGWEAV